MSNFEPGELKDEPLVEAARNVNALADEHGLATAVTMLGLDTAKLRYLAEQRALRAMAAAEGRNLNPTRPEPVALDSMQRAALRIFTAAYMDGIAIGWEGRRLASVNYRAPVEIESDGVNPATYSIPAGVSLTITDWSDAAHVQTVEGPYEGEWPERSDEDD